MRKNMKLFRGNFSGHLSINRLKFSEITRDVQKIFFGPFDGVGGDGYIFYIKKRQILDQYRKNVEIKNMSKTPVSDETHGNK